MHEDYRKAMSDLAKDIVVRKYFEHRQAARENTLARRIRRRIFFQGEEKRTAELVDVFSILETLAKKKKRKVF